MATFIVYGRYKDTHGILRDRLVGVVDETSEEAVREKLEDCGTLIEWVIEVTRR